MIRNSYNFLKILCNTENFNNVRESDYPRLFPVKTLKNKKIKKIKRAIFVHLDPLLFPFFA